ncbi:MAG: PrpF domain-containing protein, partial [Candidatus Limnocylindria bacterium]
MTIAAEAVRVADVWPAARVVGDQLAIRGVFMRGGTSRGAFLRAEDLPPDPRTRDRVILAIYGSPDARQIDGLGGGEPLTSKVAIVGAPTMPGADVDYLFGQVRISEPVVDYRGNCGNMLAAIGPFAIDEGLVPASELVTRVRIHQVNTRTLVVAEVPTRDG